MSKRVYVITLSEGDLIVFTLKDVFSNFIDTSEIFGTELSYTLYEEVDFLLDMGVGVTSPFFVDRAKEFPCLIKRIK